jgi:hypothetical protein
MDKDISKSLMRVPVYLNPEGYTLTACLLTLPYFACQAKKYRSAANGCPIKVNETQNMQFPIILPLTPSIFSRGAVMAIRGSWATIPMNATPTKCQCGLLPESSNQAYR